jgi:broad specificity phosphatase PhoE
MGTLFLVRHGQASFGADDYDQLSEMGHRQCVRLGEHLRQRGLQFDTTITGTLRRQVQSMDAIAEGLGGLPLPERRPGLDEYDSHAVVRALYGEALPPPSDPADSFRHHFRLLREGLLAWMQGRTAPEGMPDHRAFIAGVADTLTALRQRPDATALVVSSGGPISTAVGLVLDLQPPTVIELNLRIRNSAVTEFHFNAKRHSLVGFNSVAHLEQGVGPEWVTYA